MKIFFDSFRRLSSLADQILVSGGNFLTIAICAHALPLSEQGKFTYVFASYMALLLLNVAGIFQGAAVRAPAQDSSYRTSLARIQFLQAIFLSLLVSAIWLATGNSFGWQASASEAGLLLVFLVMQQLADFDRRSAYIFCTTRRAIYSSATLYIPRIIGLLIIRPNTVSEVLFVLILSALVPTTFTLFIAGRRRLETSQSWTEAAGAHLAYSRLFIVGAPLGWLWSYIPIFMLGLMHGKEQAALLASIRSISNIANVLMEQIETKVVADWARLHHGEGTSTMEVAVSRLLKIGITFWLFGMAVIVVFGQEIVSIILGSLYSPHWFLLIIGWIGYGIYFIARISAIKHRTLGANHIEFIGSLSGVATALTVSFLLIPRMQILGAAWAYVAISVGMLLAQLLMLPKKDKST